ncbi:YceI family protein [Aureispira sp. CCB-E]|uniref:YceI family protein n=1 Tax=Aureispira sp. CCB-E TaxID=3051121 RepID=UPI002868C73B|nr:YceI family protein [Aureispira sp. CCB-E]WMX12515.1 YceI family protein [Aureispira sp. CCB-E]
MPKYITFLILLLSFSTIAQQKIDEELIIFVQKSTDSPFTLENIKALQGYMQERNITTKIIDIDKTGAPKEVGYTPFIVYRNYLGRKIFKGRYTSHKRLLNFIRTVRRLPVENSSYEESNVFVWEKERSNLIIKLKVTEAQGTLPKNFSQKKFQQEYLKGLKEGFDAAKYKKNSLVGNSDELIYCSFYPYLAEDGKVYVSSEIHSHYDCHTAIYQQFETPAVGTSISKAFALAAQNSFAEIQRQLIESKLGDAMNYITDKNSVSWEALNLKKLATPEKSTITNMENIAFPKTWTIAGPVDKSTPILAFNFPPPLRHYGGELTSVTGNISLEQSQNLKAATGQFTVNVASIEMGESDLTQAVTESMLYVDKYPTAQLVFKSIDGEQLQLALGNITTAKIEVALTLLEKTAPVTATAQFEPFLDENGDLRLHVYTQFAINDLKGSYTVSGPDGPADANNKMLFRASFIMKGEE